MYLIDETYFRKDLVVPDSAPSLDIPCNEQSIEMYIDRYARQLLQNALGNVLFDELDSEIVNGSLKSSATQKWKDLVNGRSYTYNGQPYKWKGLLINEGAFKASILAQYTFIHWHIDQLSEMSSFGEVKGSSINSEMVNSTAKSVKVWNDFITMYQGNAQASNYSFSYRNGVPFHDYHSGNKSDYVCLLDYLTHNESDYPDASKLVEVEGYQNTMGL